MENLKKQSARFDEITRKMNKMFRGESEEKKDALVKSLKMWCKLNGGSDKVKFDAIKCFLANNNIF